MSADDAPQKKSAHFRKEAMGDLVTWLALLALGAASFFAAFLPLGRLNLPVALALAACQVSLIGLFFMRLKGGRTLTVVTALSASVFIVVMFTLTLNDLFSRV